MDTILWWYSECFVNHMSTWRRTTSTTVIRRGSLRPGSSSDSCPIVIRLAMRKNSVTSNGCEYGCSDLEQNAQVLYNERTSGSNSAVECDLAKVEVAGSNPVSRSRIQGQAPPGSGEFGKGAGQTRDYCVAGNATLRAARPDPSLRKECLLRMTIKLHHYRLFHLMDSFRPFRLNLGSCKARYPSGKGEVCKTFIRRFDSDPRLHS
jgi:hypothetical protein